jgi:pyrimidine operon attenuation protein/uracil phosphoribosyltransferase
MPDKKYILDKRTAEQKLQRMALEIAEQLHDEKDLILVGIKSSGLVIAEEISKMLKQHLNCSVKVIAASLDKRKPSTIDLSEAIDFNDKSIIVTDDVSNSGKTLLYALKPLLEFHPKRIQTLVLVERMHKQFSVTPDYVGLSIATTLQDHICVEAENGEVTGAYIQ